MGKMACLPVATAAGIRRRQKMRFRYVIEEFKVKKQHSGPN
jgi:hypothetical protein